MKAQEWLGKNFPEIITPQEWPPYSPDLNPMDYFIWSILESKVSSKPHKDLDSLKRHLQSQWKRISVQTLAATCANFEKRVKACIKAKGGHIEKLS